MSHLLIRVGLCQLLVWSLSAPLYGALLWSEGAETGTAFIGDGTGPTFDLIQSDVVAVGDRAFHLANPGFQDTWFSLDKTLTIQSDTKLFFLSQLRGATATQVAKVQISTNNGASWGATIFKQAGNGYPGEGAFSLKQVNLASYANQDLRFRFLFDFTSGSAFIDTDSEIGWFVDNIQIGSAFEKIPYSIGNPSPQEQLALEYTNRARADALAEANRLAAETDPEISSAYTFFGIDRPDIVTQFQYAVNNNCIDRVAQPLAFNEKLLRMSELHSQDMFNNQFQGHTSSANPPAPFPAFASLGGRLDAVGYQGAAGENVYSYASSMREAHAGFDVDWGNVTNPGIACYNPSFAGQGMQNGAGHRVNMHNGDFKEVGMGVIDGTNGSVGPNLVTQNFGSPGDVAFITGVVYEDLNQNQFYDIGEGRSGVRVDVEGSAYFALSSESGGYAIPVTADGTYQVSFSGGGFGTHQTTAQVLTRQNVKVDYLAAANGLAADLNLDGGVDAADAGIMFGNWSGTGQGDLNQDSIIDAADAGEMFAVWTGDVSFYYIPEPSGVAIPLTLGLLIARRRESVRRLVQ